VAVVLCASQVVDYRLWVLGVCLFVCCLGVVANCCGGAGASG